MHFHCLVLNTEALVAGVVLAIVAAAPAPLPTFVPQGAPVPTAGIGTGGATSRRDGTVGGGVGATGGGMLPGFALTVRMSFKASNYKN